MTQDVIIGNDGFLFLSGGNHDVIKYFTGEKEPSEDSIEVFLRNISTREEFCLKNQIKKGLKLSLNHEIRRVIKDIFDLSKIKLPKCYIE